MPAPQTHQQAKSCEYADHDVALLFPAIGRHRCCCPSSQVCATLVRWSCLLLAQLHVPAAAKAAARIVAAQAQALDALVAAPGVPWASAVRAPARLLESKPELLPEYLAAAKATGARASQHTRACRSADLCWWDNSNLRTFGWLE